jgi:hypothetical protein
MRHHVVTGICAFSLLVVLACDKKASSDAPAASATTTSVLQNISYSKKLPGKGSHKVTQKAIRGGTGDTRPSINSAKTDEPSTDRQMRKPANVDKVDCTKLADNAAECDGNSFYFCDDQALWVVDCNAEAKFGGVSGGSCFEGERFIDCLGCDTADDGSTACCDFNMTVCCDKDGACYDPKS